MPYWIGAAVALLSCAMSVLIGRALIPFLHKIHFGQTILDIGPSWHKNKQGTPIMGGFMFIISSVVCTLIGYCFYRFFGSPDPTDFETTRSALRLLSCVIFGLCFSLIGFLDDYIKAVKKQNLGLNSKQKMALQVVFSAAFLAVLYALGDRSTQIDFMICKVDFGILYYPLMILFMVYMTNAVNLLDGVDGLCGTVTVVSMLSMATICCLSELLECSLYALAVAGGCLGFLYWNLHPAKCFMGDTGSMYLGGAFVALGVVLHQQLLLVLVGIVYVLDAFSVVLQVSYFKWTAHRHYKATGERGKGKRIFKMSPIHHHFELCKWSEYKIVISFAVCGMLAGLLGILLVAFG